MKIHKIMLSGSIYGWCVVECECYVMTRGMTEEVIILI